jgi:hypothetical protein
MKMTVVCRNKQDFNCAPTEQLLEDLPTEFRIQGSYSADLTIIVEVNASVKYKGANSKKALSILESDETIAQIHSGTQAKTKEKKPVQMYGVPKTTAQRSIMIDFAEIYCERESTAGIMYVLPL